VHYENDVAKCAPDFGQMNKSIYLLTFVTALGSALVAGIFFAFSNFVMKALARVPRPQGIAAMQSINVVVLNRWFLALFFGTALCCLTLSVLSFVRWRGPGAAYLLAGSLLYLVGTIVVTIACNVPLNDALAAVDSSSADAGPVWTNYLKNWVSWNHVRTIAALAAAVTFTFGLCRVGSEIHPAGSGISSPRISAALPHEPEHWPRIFEQYLNAGNLESVMMLYEPEARLVTVSGEELVGHDVIRKVLGGLIRSKTHFQSNVVRTVTVGDIAQLYTDFEGTGFDDSGKSIPIYNKAIEILRRQSDGSWKLIVGDPNGRGQQQSG
jgi:uncharacterized membrane protein/ketosteroid isomerase-like protein